MCDSFDDCELVDHVFINNTVESLCTLFVDAAKHAFGTKCSKPETAKSFIKFKKPWFTKDCKYARKNYRKAKRLYKKYGTAALKTDVYAKEREYNKTLKSAVSQHRLNMKQTLNNLKSSNPKEYWKVINSGTKKNACKAGINDLYTFFQLMF